jgi:hypothetical protein
MNIIYGNFDNRLPGSNFEKFPIMKDGVFYNIDPPSNIQGKKFSRVQCEYKVPNKSNEYVVKGIPEGGNQPESFVLIFTDRGVQISQSEEQNF